MCIGIYQIKYLAPPDQLNINFIDPDFIETEIFTPFVGPKIVEPLKRDEVHKPIELPPQMKLSLIPSINDLKNAIKGLKPVNNKTKKFFLLAIRLFLPKINPLKNSFHDKRI